jgi:hypothetical protein
MENKSSSSSSKGAGGGGVGLKSLVEINATA